VAGPVLDPTGTVVASISVYGGPGDIPDWGLPNRDTEGASAAIGR
jgi:hypothetical protein